jgi:hypothetical protein
MTERHETKPDQNEQQRDANDSWEANWNNWWRNDQVDAVGWAALFLWGAVVVLATSSSFSEDFDWWEGWGVFFVGAGVIVIVEGLIRLGMPTYRSKWAWSMLWGTIFLALGLGGLVSPAWYALPLVGIAVLILKDAFARSA